MPMTVDMILAAWLFMLGACIGSFLNVVILRVPTGESIVHGGSHCPRCLHAIRWHDNIPVISWLLLRGRCRDCKLPISIRYPAIELVVATIFLLVGWYGPLCCDQYVPTVLSGDPKPGTSELHLWLLYAVHVTLLATLVAVTMVARDGNRVPGSLFIPALTAGVLGAIFLPTMYPTLLLPSLGEFGRWHGLASGVTGVLLGGVLGAFAPALPPGESRAGTGNRDGIVVGSLCGLLLGWQSTLFVVTMALILFLGGRVGAWMFDGVAKMPWTGHLTAAIVILIMVGQIGGRRPLSDNSGAIWAIVATAGVIWVLVTLIVRAWPPRQANRN